MPSGKRDRLTWRETYRAMAAANEDWSDLDVAVVDGLENCDGLIIEVQGQ